MEVEDDEGDEVEDYVSDDAYTDENLKEEKMVIDRVGRVVAAGKAYKV